MTSSKSVVGSGLDTRCRHPSRRTQSFFCSPYAHDFRCIVRIGKADAYAILGDILLRKHTTFIELSVPFFPSSIPRHFDRSEQKVMALSFLFLSTIAPLSAIPPILNSSFKAFDFTACEVWLEPETPKISHCLDAIKALPKGSEPVTGTMTL